MPPAIVHQDIYEHKCKTVLVWLFDVREIFARFTKAIVRNIAIIFSEAVVYAKNKISSEVPYFLQ